MRKLFLLCLLLGCGTKSGTDDPLTGNWKNETCFGTTGLPDNVSECSVTLSFDAALDFQLTATERAPPASPTRPRCLTTHEVTGQDWSVSIKDSAQVFTLTGTAKPTVKTTDCVHSEDDRGSTADPATVVANGDAGYQINGKSLVVQTGPLAGTYTKQ